VLKAIEERGLTDQIDYVLYSSDFPYDIGVSDDVAKRPMPQILTPEAAINGLTYLYQFVLAKDIRYLDMNCNRYARRVLQRTNDTMVVRRRAADLRAGPGTPDRPRQAPP